MGSAERETIVAVATPPGFGGVGIVRVSGPAAPQASQHLMGKLPAPRVATYSAIRDGEGEVIDYGLALYFPAPNSFTGEAVLEIQTHGGPVILDEIVSALLAIGLRAARPGEFSEQAFLNGKLDLVQAEAIADLITASSKEAAHSALRSLVGEFSQHIDSLVSALAELRIFVEGAIDFPEEEIDFLSDQRISDQLAALLQKLNVIQATARQGRLLREGMTVVIAGRPNAGKSSLLNALSGYASAIVTAEPGTTRDLLREQINLDGLPLHVVDTAGLRESSNAIELEGVRRAWEIIGAADRILLVVDDCLGVTEEDKQIRARLPANIPVTVIHNKIDLSGRQAGLGEEALGTMVAVSAEGGAGLDSLRSHLKSAIGYIAAPESATFMARRRHLDALARAESHLVQGNAALSDHRAGELLAEELRLAQGALGEITGEVTSDDLLGQIFSSFCVGK